MPYKETTDLEKALKEADAVYMTRIQDEYDVSGESKDIDYSKFHLTKKHLKINEENCNNNASSSKKTGN